MLVAALSGIGVGLAFYMAYRVGRRAAKIEVGRLALTKYAAAAGMAAIVAAFAFFLYGFRLAAGDAESGGGLRFEVVPAGVPERLEHALTVLLVLAVPALVGAAAGPGEPAEEPGGRGIDRAWRRGELQPAEGTEAGAEQGAEAAAARAADRARRDGSGPLRRRRAGEPDDTPSRVDPLPPPPPEPTAAGPAEAATRERPEGPRPELREP